MRIAVAGAGIAGLTAAIALAARGFDVSLYERAAALREIGAGIQLAPNAMAVLQRLGVMPALAAHLFRPEALLIRNAETGAPIARMPLGRRAQARYGAPYCTLHRADLQAALLQAVQADARIELHLGAEIADAACTANAATFTAGGERRTCDLLVGADGLRSRLRTDVFGHPGPAPLGRNAWRAVVAGTAVADLVRLDVTGLWLGAGVHLVHYPVHAGRSLNIVVVAAAGGTAPPLAAFGAAARRLLESVGEWQVSPLLRVDAARPWTRGRIALIGDAAHAMPPSAAQGGAQAIEDAWVLARTLARSPDRVQHALAAFERERRPRVLRVARESGRNLVRYELSAPLAPLRDIALGILPTNLLLHRLDWLFGWQPE